MMFEKLTRTLDRTHAACRTGFRCSAVAGAAVMALMVTLHASPALAQEGGACGSIANAFGPFDYRKERGENLRLVEGAHFTPVVEALIKGSSTYLGGDIDYTLRAFPNHHRALIATMRLGEKTKSVQPQGMRFTVECYFDRAIRFQPDDTTVRLIYATYLAKNGREKDALGQLQVAENLAKDIPFTHYNIGLVYFDLKRYDKALAEAHKAYALGFIQPGLRDQLKSVGKWKDPEPGSDPTVESPAPESAASAPAVAR